MLRARSRPRISGSAATSSCSHRRCASSSERPPRIRLASTDPVCRRRATHRSPSSVLRTQPRLHGRTLLPPSNAPSVHADPANRTSASLSPESDPKRFAHQHAFENPSVSLPNSTQSDYAGHIRASPIHTKTPPAPARQRDHWMMNAPRSLYDGRIVARCGWCRRRICI